MKTPQTPKNFEEYYEKGIRYSLAFKDEKAILAFTKAIKLNPNCAKAYLHRAQSKNTISDEEGALEDYTKTIELEPENYSAYYDRGLLKFELGDKKSGRADMKKGKEMLNDKLRWQRDKEKIDRKASRDRI